MNSNTARWALAGLALAMLLAALGNSIANVALPALGAAFGAPFPAVQWVVLAYLLANTALVVGVGRLGDLAGRRRLLLAGIAIFSLGSLLCGLAPSLPLLVAARAVQGLGAAAMMALSMALVGAAVPQAATGRAMGLLGTMSALGTALGPTLGGVLLGWLGWRAMFLVGLPLGLAGLALVWRGLAADAPLPRQRFDTRGTAVLAASLACYALAMTSGTGWHAGALLAAAAAGAWLFARVEARAPAPLLRLAVMREDGLWASLTMALLVSAVVMAALVVGPFHLARALGLDAALVGLVLSVGPATAALAGMPAGRLVDRLGAARMARLGLAVMLAGTGALALLPAGFGATGYAVPLCVTTAGYALFQAANNTAVMAGLAAGRRGLVSGLVNLARNLGLVTGASAMGAVFALAAGADPALAAPAAVAGATRATFAVAAVMVGAALAIAGFGGRQGR
jgi:MFS family permease